jgi:hypothetical protein
VDRPPTGQNGWSEGVRAGKASEGLRFDCLSLTVHSAR